MTYLAAEDVSKLDLERIPRHIAIIMDGNRRWANRNKLPPIVGHWKGAETLSAIVDAAANIGIKVLTVYAFSTENWNREPTEVDGLMHLFKMYLNAQKDRMVREGVRLCTIGDLEKLPADLKQALEETKKATQSCRRIDLVLAANYGARDDIKRATVSIVQQCLEGRIKKEDITEEMIAQSLDTAPWKDPELLIRTSGEKRLSNFLLWQISYTEVYITDVLWPDFGEEELHNALLDYQRRQRRGGG